MVSVVVFALTSLMGDPVTRILGRDALPATVAAKRAQLGLDRSVFEQYWSWLTGMLSGDPGNSYTNGEPVMDIVGDRIKNSLFLMALAAAVSVPLSLFLGAYSALKRDKSFDRVTSNQLLVFAAMPEFVVGTLLIVLFATNVWHIFPAVSRIRPGEPPWSDLDGMILPVMTLGAGRHATRRPHDAQRR